ncbi:MAG: OadG family protein [Clostridia bacterium]|nr:OadG family protein [Clostridia bacterium]
MSEILSNLGYGAVVAIIGLAVVFVGLILIIASIYAISWVLKKLTGGKKEKAPKAEPAPVPAPVAAPAVEPADEEIEVTDDNELIAVIAAAIAAMDGGSKPFVIRSVRRVAGWKNAARAEQVYKY